MGHEIEFYIVSGILLGTILLRIFKATSFGEKIAFYLFLLLYASLLATLLLWAVPPLWFHYASFTLFALGALWFLYEWLGRCYRAHRDHLVPIRNIRKKRGPLYELVAACHMLSQARMGGLIVIERKQPLDALHEKGMLVDAKLSRELLFSIFTPPGALHDGAVLIQKNRVSACGVIGPLTKSLHFPKELGTRHRAAVGFSEVSDALCLVVSEESGGVSIADRSALFYDLPFEKLPEMLEQALRFRLEKNKYSVRIL